MKLRKPPLLEAYIRFDMKLGENAPSLDERRAGEFLELSADQVKPKDVIYRDDVQIDWDKAGRATGLRRRRRVEVVRACNADETRWVQVGPLYVVLNLVRNAAKSDYAGYEDLKRAALECFDKYVQFFAPEAVREVTLHYVDVIELPKQSALPLENYLRLLPSIPPQGFGPVQRFMVALSAQASNPDDTIHVILGREPDDDVRKVHRLRMEWEAKSSNLSTLDHGELIRRLDRIHVDVRTCFRACFTDNGWQLFDPDEDEGASRVSQ